MDDSDRATHQEEMARHHAQSRRIKALISTGHCHYCTEPLPHGGLFCDADCVTEYDREMEIRGNQFCPSCFD